MIELITIVTDEQGAKVKSARELHGFLAVKSRFADWFKNRVRKYGFVEGRDFVTVSKNLESGGRELDYALTLDTAKELAMVERTEKGRQARQYFIDAEQTLRRLMSPSGPAPVDDDSMRKMLIEQQRTLTRLRSDINLLISHNRTVPPKPRSSPNQLRVPGVPEPALPLRQLIDQRISEYCEWGGYDWNEIWQYLYRRLSDVYSFNVHRINRNGSETMLDGIERYGRLNDLYKLVMAELNHT